MKKVSICLIMTLLLAGCSDPLPVEQREFNNALDSWKTVKIPKKRKVLGLTLDGKYQDFVYRAHWSDVFWEVYLKNGKAVAKLKQLEPSNNNQNLQFDAQVMFGDFPVSPNYTVPVSDGWICTYNLGEWGGAIFWFNKDGSESIELSDHQVIDIFNDNGRIFAIEGLAHLGSSQGSFIEILQRNGKWEVKTLHKLPNCPGAGVRTPSGDYTVITTRELLKINPDTGRTTLLLDTDWAWWMYPNSMAIDNNGTLYVGMRQYVAKYDSNNNAIQMLIPDRKWINKKTEH